MYKTDHQSPLWYAKKTMLSSVVGPQLAMCAAMAMHCLCPEALVENSDFFPLHPLNIRPQ
jgi:hypothetical protein